MLGTLFFLFCGANAITTFFSLFAQEILHKPTAEATILMLIFAVVAGAAALPAGKMGKKLGRKKTIVAGLAVFLVAFVMFFGVFVALLGGQGLSINKYVNVNNSYIAVEEKLNEYNADLSDAAKAEGIDLPEGSTLSIDGYIAYLTDGTDADKYMDFELFLGEESTAISNAVITAATTILELEEGTTFGEALTAVKDAVSDVTRILGILIYPVLILGGAANMFITVNTLPLVLEIGGIDKVGTFTGYYYTATFSAQIASPILYGFIRMFAGTYMSLFYYSPIMFALACILLIFVKHGEAVPDEVIKEAEEAGD